MTEFSKEVNVIFPNDFIKGLLNIKYTAAFLNALGEVQLKPYDISNAQYNILRILRGAKSPLSMQVVKDRMIEKSPNTTRLTDKLCEKKLISRVRCENDRRVVYVEITPKGLEVLEQISLASVENQLKNLTSQEVVLLNELLDKIRQTNHENK